MIFIGSLKIKFSQNIRIEEELGERKRERERLEDDVDSFTCTR